MFCLLFLYSLPFQVSYTAKSLKFQIRHQKTLKKTFALQLAIGCVKLFHWFVLCSRSPCTVLRGKNNWQRSGSGLSLLLQNVRHYQRRISSTSIWKRENYTADSKRPRGRESIRSSHCPRMKFSGWQRKIFL